MLLKDQRDKKYRKYVKTHHTLIVCSKYIYPLNFISKLPQVLCIPSLLLSSYENLYLVRDAYRLKMCEYTTMNPYNRDRQSGLLLCSYCSWYLQLFHKIITFLVSNSSSSIYAYTVVCAGIVLVLMSVGNTYNRLEVHV